MNPVTGYNHFHTRIPVAKITKDSENILATDQLNRITACDD